MSCLKDTKTPGGKVNCSMTRLSPGLELPQFWKLTTKKMRTSAPQNWRLTLPKTSKMMLVRPLIADWRWLLEMTMLFLHVTASPTLPINALTPCLSGEGVSLWTDIRHPPSEKVRKWEKAVKMKSWSFYNHTSEVKSHHFCHILLLRNKLVGWSPFKDMELHKNPKGKSYWGTS